MSHDPIRREPPRRSRVRSSARDAAKALAWAGLHACARALQTAARVTGRTRRVDAVIYKVDRLGDWLFAEQAVARIAAAVRASGGKTVVWASRESAAVRAWRPVECEVETVVFEPQGWRARLSRTWAVLRLLALYRTDAIFCLRHGADPVRDFVLRAARAKRVYALSWVIAPRPRDVVPHEIRRHAWILSGAGLAPRNVRELLPRFTPRREPDRTRIVLAPFSSAPVKDWSDTAWGAVAAAFADFSVSWELWVGRDQFERAETLATRMRQATRSARVSVHSGSLQDLADAIAGAAVVVSVDTLAAHIAVALDARMIGILGGGQFGDFAPWSHSDRQRWVSHPLPCFSCNWQCTRAQNDCLRFIAPEAVIAQMHSLMDPLPLPAPDLRLETA